MTAESLLTTSKMDEFITWAKEGVAQVMASFDDPEDDLSPVMLFEDADGQKGIVGFHPEFMDDENKDKLERAMLEMLKEQKAVRYAFISSAWMVERDKDGPLPDGFIRDEPDRMEVVVMVIGDGDQEHIHRAKILRDGEQPPVLGEWEDMGGRGSGRFMGLNEALR